MNRFAPFTGKSYEIGVTDLGQAGRDLRAVRRPVAALELHGARRRDVRADPVRRDPRLVHPGIFRKQLAGAGLARLLDRALRADQDLRRFPGLARRAARRTPTPISGFYWRMGQDIGLDQYGGGVGR